MLCHEDSKQEPARFATRLLGCSAPIELYQSSIVTLSPFPIASMLHTLLFILPLSVLLHSLFGVCSVCISFLVVGRINRTGSINRIKSPNLYDTSLLASNSTTVVISQCD